MPTSAGALERLCRYITRPALANERVQCNAAGQVVLKLKMPRARLHLIRFHGVLAPNAKLRARGSRQGRTSAPTHRNSLRAPVRMSWARLLKRVFEIDLELCPNCGGELKIIAAILEAPVIDRILTHLALQARAPPRAPARGQMPLQAA